MVRAVLMLALLAVAVLLLAGPSVRLGLWPFPVGFQLMKYAAYAGAIAAIMAIVLLLVPRTRRAGAGRLAIAAALGSLVFGLPWWQLQQARRVPEIHDISTDLSDPPAFVAVLPLRAGAPNPAKYGGEAVAEQQRRAYPDVQPLMLKLPPAKAFAAALSSARGMGWKIVAADPAQGRIEATATTLWFGFKDDVVIRVRAEGAGARIDVRSLSRVGRSDVGANASRIRDYLARLRSRSNA
ncbi:MAG: DUF1499 domain-containing protein [Gammaproteobacteria bacterium]|nr:DUF1499 domain-containing protein [Gammaproteobacteria bacterium]